MVLTSNKRFNLTNPQPPFGYLPSPACIILQMNLYLTPYLSIKQSINVPISLVYKYNKNTTRSSDFSSILRNFCCYSNLWLKDVIICCISFPQKYSLWHIIKQSLPSHPILHFPFVKYLLPCPYFQTVSVARYEVGLL